MSARSMLAALLRIASCGACLAGIMAMETLSITEAKNRFAEIADRAAAEHDHVTVTRNGHPHVMVVSVEEWDSGPRTLRRIGRSGRSVTNLDWLR